MCISYACYHQQHQLSITAYCCNEVDARLAWGVCKGASSFALCAESGDGSSSKALWMDTATFRSCVFRAHAARGRCSAAEAAT